MLVTLGSEPIPGHRVVKKLGAGSFGVVYCAITTAGIEVALKFIRLDGVSGLKELRALVLIKNVRDAHLLSISDMWLLDESGDEMDASVFERLLHSNSTTDDKRGTIEPPQTLPTTLIVKMPLAEGNLFDVA